MFIADMIFKRLTSGLWADIGNADRLDQLTVDAVPDTDFLVERLDVDIGGSVAQRLADDARHQLHHRRLIVEADRVDGFFGGLAGCVGLLERGHEATDVGVGTPELLGVGGDGLRVGGEPLEPLPGRCLRRLALGR